MFKKILVLIAIALPGIALAGAANEPFSSAEKLSVTKTLDGRIILRGGPSAADQSAACAGQAKTYINDLLPQAEALAGQKIDVEVPDDAITARVGTDEDPLAIWNAREPGRGSITIFTDFCRQGAADQRATTAHELGHAIDGIVRPAPTPCGSGFGCRAANTVAAAFDDSARPWEARRGEIAATAWALAIYRRAGLPVGEIEAHFAHRTHDYWPAVQSYPTTTPDPVTIFDKERAVLLIVEGQGLLEEKGGEVWVKPGEIVVCGDHPDECKIRYSVKIERDTNLTSAAAQLRNKSFKTQIDELSALALHPLEIISVTNEGDRVIIHVQ